MKRSFYSRLPLSTILGCLLLGACRGPAEIPAPAITDTVAMAVPSATVTAVAPPKAPLSGSIAYLAHPAECCGMADLYRMDADGANAFRLLANVTSFQWSPSGDQLLAHASPLNESGIFLFTAPSAPPVRLSGGGFPAWSPQGDRFAFEDLIAGQWFLCDKEPVPGAEPRRLAELTMGGSMPAWSPDGQWVAFLDYRDGVRSLKKVRADGTGLTTLADSAREMTRIAWSPDGTRILFAREADRQADIFSVGSDGMDLRRLTESAGSDDEAVWSPDGAWIAFVSFRVDDRPGIYIMRADGSDPWQIAAGAGKDGAPAWSPDGKWLLFNSDRDGNSEIYLVEVTRGALPLRLTNSALNEGAPAWQPQPDS